MVQRRIFINLTQHTTTAAQVADAQSKGWEVMELPKALQDEVKTLITFDDLPSQSEMVARAKRLADIAESVKGRDANGLLEHRHIVYAMIGGTPFFQSLLENALGAKGNVVGCYAFSKRKAVETTNEDGSVTKTAVFEHEGFVFPYRGAL